MKYLYNNKKSVKINIYFFLRSCIVNIVKKSVTLLELSKLLVKLHKEDKLSIGDI